MRQLATLGARMTKRIKAIRRKRYTVGSYHDVDFGGYKVSYIDNSRTIKGFRVVNA